MLKKIIEQQKQEFLSRITEPYVSRSLVFEPFSNDLIKVILGPRRAGKSFLALHLAHAAGSFGYVNFDDEFLVGITDTQALMKAVDEVWGNPVNLLFDEVQNINNWELLLNRLQRQGRRLIVTGSNAHLLGSELATHLTGRHLPFVLLPFSFGEYVSSVSGIEPASGDDRVMLSNYLIGGGFPEPLLKNVERRQYLSSLFESIIFKDIIRRFNIRAHAGIYAAARYLLSNTCCEYSNSRIAEVAGCKSVKTAEKYIGFLEQAFLFFSLPRFSWKVREQIRTNRKIYCIDNGFITSGGFTISADTGRLAENMTAIALFMKKLKGQIELFFWKNRENHEVDFVIKKDNKVIRLVQVCWNLSDTRTREREIRALLSCGDELKCDDLLILTDDVEKCEQASWFGKTGEIRFQPLQKWLFEQGTND